MAIVRVLHWLFSFHFLLLRTFPNYMKTILVPTDYSENANHALRFAIRASETSDLRLIVFHWIEILIPTSTPTHIYKDLYDKELAEKLAELQEHTQNTLGNDTKNVSQIDIAYVIKDASSLTVALAETVAELNVDLIVMGTRGASGLKKIFLGSNTTNVIDEVPAPVMAIPSGYPIGPIDKIGYATDLKDVVGEVGELVKFAQLFRASIEIFHVYPSFPQWMEVTEENVERLSLQLHERYPGQQFVIRVIQTYKENDVLNGIETYVKSYKPDVLAMFTVKRTFWDKMFDASRTEEIAFNTSIPLITLKKK